MNEVNKKYLTGILMAIILATGIIFSSFIVIKGVIQAKKGDTITITGSAKKEIKSDFISWKGNFFVQSTNKKQAYTKLLDDMQKVKKYLLDKGITENELVFSTVITTNNYLPLPNGQMSAQIDSYNLSMTVEVKSKEVDKITEISRASTELINQDVNFESLQPEYLVTNISQLKINMLEEATKDAKARAEKIVSATGGKVGRLTTAKMGVFQITPPYSNEVSDYGLNDTSSIKKEITSVVNCTFEMQ